MSTEQRRALAGTVPTTEVVKDAVTFPRDRLGEPLDISPERFDAWLTQVKRTAAREALTGYATQEEESFLDLHVNDAPISAAQCTHAAITVREYCDQHYPEETP